MRSNILAAGLSALVIFSAVMWVGAKRENKKLEAGLTKEISKVDSVTAKNKLLADDEKKLNARLDSSVKKNDSLSQSIAQVNAKLASREHDMRKARKMNEESAKKISEWQASQKQWENKIQELNSVNQKLQQQNNQLLAQVALLTDDNRQLKDNLSATALLTKDNISVEAFAKNGKPHAKARKIKKIAIAFTTARELNSPGFKIFDPSGSALPDQYGKFQFNLNKENQSTTGVMKLELTYLLSKHIGKGLYRIEIVNENKHVGNLFVRFR